MASNKKLRVAGVEPESIVDGRGFRYVVFVQGCPHRCPGCHNPQTHPFSGGESKDPLELLPPILENPLLRGVTFSGGEPFCQAEALCVLAERVKGAGRLDLTCYSGWTYEELLRLKDPWVDRLLSFADYLVDGKFLEEEMDLSLSFRGSQNQRVIDLNATRREGRLVLDEVDE